MKPTKIDDNFTIDVTLVEYGAQTRNVEGKGNVIYLNSTTESTILSYSKEKEEKIFYQIISCSSKADITYSIVNAYKTTEELVQETKIEANTNNYFSTFDNTYGEAQLIFTGEIGDKRFVKHKGIDEKYTPDVKSSFPILFDSSKNAIIFSRPLNNFESFTYTIYVGKDGELSSKQLSICSLIDSKEILDSFYSKTFTTNADEYSLPINFKKINLREGDIFEAIAFIEQDNFSQMSFMTDLLTAIVGEIKEETIIDISTPYYIDPDYVFYQQEAKTETSTFYYSFMNSNIYDPPVGAFRIIIDSNSGGSFNTIYCAWVDNGADPITMVEAIDEVISKNNSFCFGGKNIIENKKYNYLFKYTYTNDNQPRRMVIKVQDVDPNTGFNIYIRNGENFQIEKTEFTDLIEYGRLEEYKSSLIPYILDLPTIRGNDSTSDYVSKILIYSRNFEMQMYYIGESNLPVKLFTGNVMLVYTKPSLALQKYFSTKLILLSESINGQELPYTNYFRFHTKMLRSSDQIEYFFSNNPQGRTLNYLPICCSAVAWNEVQKLVF